MKRYSKVLLSLIFFLLSNSVQAEHLLVGSDVLANCHGFFSKGKVKKTHKERYVVHFYKDVRPVLCTPFAWDIMFLVPFESVEQYKGKLSSSFFGGATDQIFKVGDKLKIKFRASIRGQFLNLNGDVSTVIKSINANGAAQLEVVAGEDKAKLIFTRWVGTNYVSLDFSKTLVADRLTILKVEME